MHDDKVNILLVDDQPQKLLSYEIILGPLEENLFRADSARAAFDILLRMDIAVILLDVVMPELDGFEFARMVREHPRFKHVPMIFVTAVSTSDAELVEGYGLGAVDYVCVPVIPEVLRAKVSVFVDLHRKTAQLVGLNRNLENRIAERTREIEQTLEIAEENARRLEQEMAVRLNAEEALRQRAEELETLLETLPIGVFIAHDPACHRITGNHIGHEMLRLPPQDNLSITVAGSVLPDHFRVCRNGEVVPVEERPLHVAARGTPVRESELEIVFTDGCVTHSLVSATPLFDSNGQPRGAVGAMVDITVRKQAEQAAIDADRRKDEFLAILAHELRNPLAPLANSLELLNDSDLDATESHQIREIMRRQVNHLRRLVDDLLDVSRITRNQIELKLGPVELSAIVSNALDSCRPIVDAVRHEIFLELPKDPIWVNADWVRMTQVVSNLVNNAAKYTARGGKIWVSCCATANEAEVRVKDNGIGISPAAMPNIFDMFTRGDTSLTRATDGLGVGLTLVKELVELHGGSVYATSDGIGCGSQFIVRLPIHHQDLASGTPKSVTRNDSGSFPQYQILVVDDMPASAYLVSRLLMALGQDVATAQDGATALATIDRQRPSLVISDISMPEMDGFELARRIRALPESDSIYLVALTGYGQVKDRVMAREAGFDCHLVKPVSMSDLRNILDTLGQRTPRVTAKR